MTKPRANTRVTTSHAGSPAPQMALGVEATQLQQTAASPDTSVWVAASAGSGKTKVLTDRILRLLLPRRDGRPGTPPHKILAITFTKAGASEMRLRLTNTLSRWAVMGEHDLGAALEKLLGHTPTPDEIKSAQQLFAELTESARGMSIVTIHAFCQSVLGRFPLEAGLSPSFTVLDERQAQGLLHQAGDTVLHDAATEKTGPLAAAINRLGSSISADQFAEAMSGINSERHQLHKILQRHFSPNGAYTALCASLGITAGQTPEDIIAAACSISAEDTTDLKSAAQTLLRDKAQGRLKLGQTLTEWLAQDVAERAANFETYARAYLTQEGLPSKNIFNDKFQRESGDHYAVLMTEAERLMQVQERVNAANCALLTHALMTLGQRIIGEYEEMKQSRNVLDFDDLIARTMELLGGGTMASWVQYKLDEGLDHILIDEAQDTNPEQWEIVKALADEFMAGVGARNDARTIFVVGDEKQSIYSFQRAAPEHFKNMRAYFERRVREAKQAWETVPMNVSFRSTNAVLAAVDAVFPATQHHAYRAGQPGLVEMWPLMVSDQTPKLDPWDPPVTIMETKGGAAALAEEIAIKIKNWIGKETLPSYGRTIQPQDILILVRTRNAFFHQITRALRQKNIPVSGMDRLVLNQHMAVQDMTALAEFCLLPSDDLTLACILKSPLIGWNEDDLFNAAYQRAGTLFDSVKKYSPETFDYLEQARRLSRELRPFDFFSAILQQPCPGDHVSGLRAFAGRLGSDALDPLDELLNATLSYEQSEIPSLQGFLKWQAQETSGIKREMEEARAEVRIMTVHGAKGLQAPIVILPDTAGMPLAEREKMLWPDKTSFPAPIFCPRKEDSFKAYDEAQGVIRGRLYDEYQRLLYVAMTRAEDRLYVCGYQGKKPVNDDAWYSIVRRALESMPGIQTTDDGTLRLETAGGAAPDKKDKAQLAATKAEPLPDWINQPAPEEPAIPRPLRPSRPEEDEPAASSPLAGLGTARFQRGILTHKLLQYLPALPPAARRTAAEKFIGAFGGNVPAALHADIVNETIAVIEKFAPFFSADGQAEVPVTGMNADGRVISGQIDRLVIGKDGIWIIDYKSNRPPPQNQKDVPRIYITQMRAYADILKRIYPGHTIHSALLWTDGPRLMELEL